MDLPPRLIVMGDSLSAQHDSWPQHGDFDKWNLQIMAQSGRTIRDFDVPRDLKAQRPGDTVIYFLGINDLYYGSAHAELFLRTLPNMRLHFQTLDSKGFKTLVLLLPLIAAGTAKNWRNLRINMIRESKLYDSFRFYDLQRTWRDEDTTDGIHPTVLLSRDMGAAIAGVL